MKKLHKRWLRRLAVGGSVLAAVLGLGTGIAFAAHQDVVVSGTTDSTIYKAGQTVTITGTVNGDVFCAGQTVTIDAVVNGDIFCAGQSVNVNGTVHGSVRIAGQTVDIGATVDHGASLVAQNGTLQTNAAVGGDMGVVGQSIALDGQIGRDVQSIANELTLNGQIGRNVQATVKNLVLGSRARIGDNLTYTSPTSLNKARGAIIGGSVTYHYKAKSTGSHRSWGAGALIGHLFTFASLLLFALVLVALFPQVFAAWNKRASSRLWVPLLVGIVAMFAVPVIFLVLLLTVVGVPLALFVGLAWLAVLLLSAPAAAYYVGQLILRREKRALLLVLVGGVVLGLVSLIPILGWIVSLVAMWYGTGAILLSSKRLYKRPQYVN